MVCENISSKHCQSQTGRARELNFSENVHPTLCVMCHVSCVTCHVSPVTCHVSPVTCNFLFFIFFILKKIGQSGGASCRRVCYQRGLPRLVLQYLPYFFSLKSSSSCTLSATALTKVSLEAHRKNVEVELSRKDYWAHMVPGAKHYTSVLDPICFGTKHLNRVVHE